MSPTIKHKPDCAALRAPAPCAWSPTCTCGADTPKPIAAQGEEVSDFIPIVYPEEMPGMPPANGKDILLSSQEILISAQRQWIAFLERKWAAQQEAVATADELLSMLPTHAPSGEAVAKAVERLESGISGPWHGAGTLFPDIRIILTALADAQRENEALKQRLASCCPMCRGVGVIDINDLNEAEDAATEART